MKEQLKKTVLIWTKVKQFFFNRKFNFIIFLREVIEKVIVVVAKKYFISLLEEHYIFTVVNIRN